MMTILTSKLTSSLRMNRSKELPKEYLMVLQEAQSHLIPFEIATNPKYDPNWHHRIIADELEQIEKHGDEFFKIFVITVPPRHGKSQMCSIDFPAWYLGRNPEKEIITASYSGELAQEFGGRTREKVNSKEFQAIFPDVKLREDEQSRGRWKTKQGGGYVSVGVGGPITGRGANILLIDDPIKNREEAESEVYRDRVWSWFTSTAFTRLEPKGVVILIMTRWHLDDLAGRVMANKELAKRTKVIRFPAISTFRDEYRGENEALWPERYPIRELAEIKSSIGPYDWEALYQGSPVLTERQEFKPDWIKRTTEQQVSVMNCRRFLTIDTAMSKRTSSDYTGFCDNRINNQNFWHLKAWRVRLGPEELIDNLFSLHQSNKYEKIGIEKTSYLWGLKPFIDAEQRKRGVYLPIVELEHQQVSKEIRVRGLQPRYASGSIYHIEGECVALEEEQAAFPLGIHDDVLDAEAYQIQLTESVMMPHRMEITEEPVDKFELFN